ncbi:hypothetical protein, partial [Paludibacterium sp.]|uniref:hypothetical protein n=1 Tax=Paludibacterium sp. TaxID=1917523 RepID=UPI0025ED7587
AAMFSQASLSGGNAAFLRNLNPSLHGLQLGQDRLPIYFLCMIIILNKKFMETMNGRDRSFISAAKSA